MTDEDIKLRKNLAKASHDPDTNIMILLCNTYYSLKSDASK